MLSEAQVEMLPGFGFILKTPVSSGKSSGVIVSLEEDDYNDLDVDWIYDICRLQVQRQLEIENKKIKTNIMKHEIKLC